MSTSEPERQEERANANVPFKPLIFISTLVVAVQVVIGFLIYFGFSSWNERADFGEMFGAVNTLFSGLAFAGVIFAIFLQRRELELQRYELEMTRVELRRSAEAQEKSEQALSAQVEMLDRTSRLNALNSIVEAYSGKLEQMRRDGYHHTGDLYTAKRDEYDKYLKLLEALTKEIEDNQRARRLDELNTPNTL